jgi:hypothetical protein
MKTKRPKRKLKAQPGGSLEPVGSAALAREAFQHGQLVGRKANEGLGYDRPWDDVPEPTKKAFLAMTRFIIRAVKPNVAHHWRRASDVQYETGMESRRPVHAHCSAALHLSSHFR